MSAAKPLEGLRVVDCTVVHGELAARLLADLGAEVVKVEPPGGFPGASPGPAARGRVAVVRGAQRRQAGRRARPGRRGRPRALPDLLDHADVLVCSSAELADGLDVDGLAAAHPHLVVAAVTPFGLTGPWAAWEATDAVLSATSGMSFKAGLPDREPLPTPGFMCHDIGSSTAAFGVLCALWQSLSSGAGQVLDVSLNEAVAQTADWSLPNTSARLLAGEDVVDVRNGSGPVYPIFRCRDGYVRLIVLSPRQWHSMRAWLGEPEYLQDEEYDGFPARLAISDAVLNPLYEELFADMSVEQVSEEAQARGIVCTPVLDPPRVLTNEHFESRGTFTDLEVAPGVTARTSSGYYEIDGQRVGPAAPPPAPGEHTDRVFAALGEARRATGAPPAPVAPLEGLRVMDFGHGAVGVEAGRMFADYGAEVIKIETRTYYDFIRVITGTEMGPSFASSNRTKLGLGINAKHPEGRELLRKLAALSDVAIENASTGAMDNIGAGYADLSDANPSIVMASSQLMGSRGLWADWRGYGPSTQAPGGLSYLWSYADTEAPAGTGAIFPDHFVGRLCAVASLAMLIGRSRGVLTGGHVEVAQVEAVIGVLADLLAAESLDAGSVRPLGTRNEQGAPWGLYRCEGREEWVADHLPRRRRLGGAGGGDGLAGLGGRRPPTPPPTGAGRPRTSSTPASGSGPPASTKEEVARRCQEAGCPAGPMMTARRHARERGLPGPGSFPTPLEQPGVGTISLEGPAFRGTSIAPVPPRPAPWLGEHTERICTELLGRGRRRGAAPHRGRRARDHAASSRAERARAPVSPPRGTRRGSARPTPATGPSAGRTGARSGGPGPTAGRRRGPRPTRAGRWSAAGPACRASPSRPSARPPVAGWAPARPPRRRASEGAGPGAGSAASGEATTGRPGRAAATSARARRGARRGPGRAAWARRGACPARPRRPRRSGRPCRRRGGGRRW